MAHSELAPNLKVLHFGRVSKKSHDGKTTQYCARWCVLTYGIFTYFRTCEKARKFLESLPFSKKNINVELTRDQHRIAFKNCLEETPPRGYIKLLDRRGNRVSDILVDEFHRQIKITHKERYFDLKMDTNDCFNKWMSAFTALGLDIKYENDDNNNCLTEHSMLQKSQYQAQIVEFDKLANENFEFDNKSHLYTEHMGSVNTSLSPNNDNDKNNKADDECIHPNNENNENNKNVGNVENEKEKEKEIEKEESNEYDEEDQRLLKEQEKLMKLLKNDQNKIMEEFSNLQKAIVSDKES